MNQTAETNNQTTPPKETKPVNTGNFKNIIIAIIVIVIIALGSIILVNFNNQQKLETRIAKDNEITQIIFSLRTNATTHYEKNKSYKDWWPQSQILALAQNLDTTIIYRKPDFQNYIIYAYVPGHTKYFCVDTTGFADEIVAITDEQNKCQ